MMPPHMDITPMGMMGHMDPMMPIGKSQYKTYYTLWVVKMCTNLLHCFIMFCYYMQHIHVISQLVLQMWYLSFIAFFETLL